MTSIKDLVIQTLTNGAEIKAKVENGDAMSCFQMGMIHLLGVNTPIDFDKASQYLASEFLSDDPEANRLLGFIEECEGNYLLAFQKYANADNTTESFLHKVFVARRELQKYFEKLGLPNSLLNKEISFVLEDNEYITIGSKVLDAKIKLAYICEDEQSFIDVAQVLFDSGDFFSAKSWLQMGGVDTNNPLYVSIDKKLSESKKNVTIPEFFDVIDINGCSLVSDSEVNYSYSRMKQVCDNTAKLCRQEWSAKITQIVNTYKNAWEKEERRKLKQQQEEEKARLKKIKDEEMALLRKKNDEEFARIKKLQEEENARQKRIQEKENARWIMENEARKEREKEKARKEDRKYFIILGMVFVLSVLSSWYLGLSLVASIGFVVVALLLTLFIIVKYLV